MPPPVSLEQRLNKFKIEKPQYEEWSEKLTRLGFEKKDSDRLILRRSSSNTVETLIRLSTELKNHFKCKQLIQIAAHDGGSKNLETVKTSYQALKDLNFTPEQIVQIAAHAGGSKNLEAVSNYSITFPNSNSISYIITESKKIMASRGWKKSADVDSSSGLDNEIIEIALSLMNDFSQPPQFSFTSVNFESISPSASSNDLRSTSEAVNNSKAIQPQSSRKRKNSDNSEKIKRPELITQFSEESTLQHQGPALPVPYPDMYSPMPIAEEPDVQTPSNSGGIGLVDSETIKRPKLTTQFSEESTLQHQGPALPVPYPDMCSPMPTVGEEYDKSSSSFNIANIFMSNLNKTQNSALPDLIQTCIKKN